MGTIRTNERAPNRQQILKQRARPAIPRDDLSEAFAGTENLGPSGSKMKGDFKHSTQLKSRVTRESREKIPKR